MNKITYHKEGDYLIPDINVENSRKGHHIRLYGRLKLEYMKKHQLGLYSDLILNGTLPEYLIEIDKTANERVKILLMNLLRQKMLMKT
ncbi:MAG: TnpV protein [Clostridia bacterium]|nr:TnpV protein [Clostridia bacterium]